MLFSCFLQVIHGGENLLEVVDALDEAAAQQEAALAEEQAAEARAAARIAELEGDQLNIEEQFSSVQVGSAPFDWLLVTQALFREAVLCVRNGSDRPAEVLLH